MIILNHINIILIIIICTSVTTVVCSVLQLFAVINNWVITGPKTKLTQNYIKANKLWIIAASLTNYAHAAGQRGFGWWFDK